MEETKGLCSLSMKLNVISRQTFGIAPQGSRIQLIISLAGHQVIRNLSEPSEFTMIHLDSYADYLRQAEPCVVSRAVRALLTTGGTRTRNLHERYFEVYGPYQVMLNVVGISIHTKTYVTTDNEQKGQIYLGREELKANSGEPNRKPRVSFSEQPIRGRTYGSTRGRGNSSSNATGKTDRGVQRISEETLLAADQS